MLSPDDSFFFDQAAWRHPVRRYKKSIDELPQSLRYAHLNPKLASFYKDNKGGEEAVPEAEEDTKDQSILPEISNTFASIRSQILSGFMPDYDSTRLALQENKTATPGMLEELARYLPLVKLSKKKLTYPRSLETNLQSVYDDLVYEAKYVKRDWQVLENQIKHDAEEREKTQREAASQPGDGKKSKLDNGSDSDEELAKMEQAELEMSRSQLGSRGKSRHRKHRHRHTQSQPAVILEEGPSTQSNTSRSSPGKKHRNPSARAASGRKAATAPGKDRLGLPRAGQGGGGDDALSEASHSIKSNMPAHPQPYSMTVLAFNLSNYTSWEDKGCHVFGIDKSEDNEHPLEWVVKRLNKASSLIKMQHNKQHTELPYTRYYSDNFSEKNLLKSAGDRLGIFNTVMKGGKPKIPSLRTKANKDKGQLLCTQTTDGSKVLYYDNGEVAMAVSHSGAKGYYTLIFDYEDPKKMLASFTPLGTGCCYSTKNTPVLLITAQGGFVTDDDENTEDWKWSGGVNSKLSSPFTIHLNRYIAIKVVGRSNITLTFQSASHTIKLPLGLTQGLDSLDPPATDELYPLMMSDKVTYTSQAALELMQRQKFSNNSSLDKLPSTSVLRKARERSSKTPKREESSSVDFSDTATVIVQADFSKTQREFLKLQNRAKNLVDSWMEAYRVALGMTAPQIKNMKLSTDWSSRIQTAKSLPPDPENYNADELASTPIPLITEVERSGRIPSAPSAPPFGLTPKQSHHLPVIKINNEEESSGYGPWVGLHITESLPADSIAPRLSARERSTNTLRNTREPAAASSPLKLPSPMISADAPKLHGLMSEWTMANHYQCPVALRAQLLGQPFSGPHVCRCARRRVAYIKDVELETFITQIVPPKQLIVISIVSSLFPEKATGSDMLDRLHAERNTNRTHVCMQSRSDPFRVFKYDVVTAYFESNHTQPLLLSRHNAVPGMFLIFQGGRLIFCDHIFNGYGNAKKDFQKQLVHCRKIAYQGFSLPKDFKFSPQTGKAGYRAPWGGEIGGTGVDMFGHPGTSSIMPRIDHKEGCSSPDSIATLEYHIGKNLAREDDGDVHTSKTLVGRLSKKYARIVPPAHSSVLSVNSSTQSLRSTAAAK